MADPFAIIGLVDAVVGWSLEIYGFLSAVADAPDEIKALLTELHDLQGIFPLVRDSAIRTSRSSILLNDSKQWLPMLHSTLEQCRTEFKTLMTFAVSSKQDRHIHQWERLYRKATWVLNQNAIQQCTNRLERYKLSLTLILQISSQQIGITISSHVQSLETEFHNAMPNLDSQVLQLQLMFQQSATDIQKQVQRFMDIMENLDHKSQERLMDLEGSMSQPLQSLPQPTRINAVTEDSADPTKAEKDSVAAESLVDPVARPDIWPNVLALAQKQIDEQNASYRERFLLHYTQSSEAMVKIVTLLQKSVSDDHQSAFSVKIVNALQEIFEIIQLCQREYELYPDPSLSKKITSFYAAALAFTTIASFELETPSRRSRLLVQTFKLEPWSGFAEQMATLRKSSDEVLKEVEYLGRRETRIASERLKFMEKDQQRILMAVEEQKRILSELQQQTQILDLIKDQQMTLQGIQNLLIQLHPVGLSKEDNLHEVAAKYADADRK